MNTCNNWQINVVKIEAFSYKLLVSFLKNLCSSKAWLNDIFVHGLTCEQVFEFDTHRLPVIPVTLLNKNFAIFHTNSRFFSPSNIEFFNTAQMDSDRWLISDYTRAFIPCFWSSILVCAWRQVVCMYNSPPPPLLSCLSSRRNVAFGAVEVELESRNTPGQSSFHSCTFQLKNSATPAFTILVLPKAVSQPLLTSSTPILILLRLWQFMN